ncbi:MAG: hypothetical protein ACE5GM_08490 [bacterium]
MAIGLIIYFYAQWGMFLRVYRNRTSPIEANDAYAYIAKAAQMQECFFQDSPALNDLHRQIQNRNTESERFRRINKRMEFLRGFVVYAPLHSLLLVGLHQTGLSWESAYKTLSGIGVTGLGLAIAFWLYTVWGSGAAGITLFLLTFHIFPDQGLHYIVPGNLTLGIAMVTWGLIIKQRDAAARIMIGAIIIMIAMHPIGRLYSLATVALYFLLSGRPRDKRTRVLCGAGVMLAIIPFMLPSLVSRPVLSLPSYKRSLSLIQYSLNGTRKNINRAAFVVNDQVLTNYNWLEIVRQKLGRYRALPFPGYMSIVSSYAVLLALFVMGLVFAEPYRIRVIFRMLALLTLMLAGSLFYWRIERPALLFLRLWPSFGIMFLGAVGNAAWFWIDSLFTFLQKLSAKKTVTPAGAGLAILGLISGGGVVVQQSVSFKNYNKTITRMAYKRNYAMDPDQPAMVLSRSRKGDSVLYTNEVAMHYFFAHGLYRLGAFYWPAIKGDAGKFWAGRRSNIRYVASWNAVKENLGTLPLFYNWKIEFRSTELKRLDSLFFHLENRGDEAVIELAFPDKQSPKTIRFKVPPRFTGWLQAPADNRPPADNFLITVIRKNVHVRLKGLRLSKDKGLNWPWDQGVSLKMLLPLHRAAIKPKTIDFKTTDICPELGLPLRIVADSGSSLLAEVINRP